MAGGGFVVQETAPKNKKNKSTTAAILPLFMTNSDLFTFGKKKPSPLRGNFFTLFHLKMDTYEYVMGV
ncbi:MAG: hypothetical protein N2Z76_05230 [Treponemataceae bacterium]|nr:hypothetical protein [Treponemataceae bacterium]